MAGMLLLLSATWAAEGPGAAIAPGATPMQDGRFEVDGGVTALAYLVQEYCLEKRATAASCGGTFLGGTPGLELEARGTPVDRLVLHGTAIGGLGDAYTAGGQVDVAYAALDTEHVHLAPWLWGGGLWENPAAAAAGLAFDVGGRVASFDVSVPVVAVIDSYGRVELAPYPALFAASSLGVTFRLGETQALRVGTESFLPGLAWRGTFGKTFLEARLHASPIVGATSFVVGRTF